MYVLLLQCTINAAKYFIHPSDEGLKRCIQIMIPYASSCAIGLLAWVLTRHNRGGMYVHMHMAYCVHMQI